MLLHESTRNLMLWHAALQNYLMNDNALRPSPAASSSSESTSASWHPCCCPACNGPVEPAPWRWARHAAAGGKLSSRYLRMLARFCFSKGSTSLGNGLYTTSCSRSSLCLQGLKGSSHEQTGLVCEILKRLKHCCSNRVALTACWRARLGIIWPS